MPIIPAKHYKLSGKIIVFIISKTNSKWLFLSLLKSNEIPIISFIETRPQALQSQWLGYGCSIKKAQFIEEKEMTGIVNKIIALYTPVFAPMYKSGNMTK